MKLVRIGNGCGFWGDNLDAPILLAEQGQLDYLTLEYLAGLTMSILTRAGQQPQTGCTDFLSARAVVPILKSATRLRIVRTPAA